MQLDGGLAVHRNTLLHLKAMAAEEQAVQAVTEDNLEKIHRPQQAKVAIMVSLEDFMEEAEAARVPHGPPVAEALAALCE
jgi:hypothetical protein